MTVVAALLALVSVTGCGSGDDKNSPAVTIGLNSDGGSLDPSKAAPGYSRVMDVLAYEPIIGLGSKGLVPGLATSWRYVGTGNKTFEFTLRRNARFSDGTPVTAQAVKTWLSYYLKTSPIAALFPGPVQKVDTIGRWTVRLHPASPNPGLPRAFAFNPGLLASPKAVANPKTLATTTAGAGPYVLVPSQSVSGNRYVFVPNKYYYDTSAIKFKKVVVKIFTSPSAMLQAAQTGQLDVAYGDTSTADAAARAGFSVVSAPALYDSLWLQDRVGNSPLADVRVRRALNYAIDRNAITKALAGKYGAPTSQGTTTDGGQQFTDYYRFDPRKAKALLAAAGYADGFTLTVNAQGFAGSYGTPVAEAAAKYLGNVGVKLKITSSPTSDGWGNRAVGTAFATDEALRGIVPMALWYQAWGSPSSPQNPFKVSDPVLAGLFEKAVSAANPSSYWRKMAQRLTTQAVEVPVFKVETLWFVRKNIGGVRPTFENNAVVDPIEWYPK